ncbi:MAG: hypothetical protein ABJH98_19165 [Reichenbachiella sp.]|uniref:hypothetical protein n=1 Tax=Reichenbachiella sp. TaxID=2184521 RepID=UPI0032998F00
MPIDIKVSFYLPFNFIIIGYGIIAAGLGAIFTRPEATPFLLIVGILMVTTHYRLNINVNKNHFNEYLWVLGFKKGKYFDYEKAEYVFLKEAKNVFTYVSKYNDSMTDIGQPRHGKEYVFKAYIKFTGQEEPAYIGSSKRLNFILKKSKEIANQLNIPIKNYS